MPAQVVCNNNYVDVEWYGKETEVVPTIAFLHGKTKSQVI